jgi:hypothetical protein
MQGALLGPFGRYELGREVVTLGRLPANTIVIDDSKASGRHAEVWPDGAGYMLVDVGSTNGTLLNGQPLRPQQPQPLRDGDVITIGLAQVTVEMTAGQDASLVTEPLAAPVRAAYEPTERLAPSAASSLAPTQQVAPSNLPMYSASPAYAPPPPLPPPYVLPSPPKKRSAKKWILLGVGSGLAFILLACTCIGVLVYAIYTHSPEGVTKQYYTDVKNQDYAAAYQLLGNGAQQLLTLEAQQNHLATGQQLYTAVFVCLDRQFGPVTAYTTALRGQDNGRAAVDVSVTRSREQYTDPIQLIQESSGWKIALFLLPPNQQCLKTNAGSAVGI